MFIHIHCNAVADGLVPDGSCRGGVECTKKGVPVLFTQVIDKIVVMDMVIFRTIFFELLVFFTFMLLTLHFAY